MKLLAVLTSLIFLSISLTPTGAQALGNGFILSDPGVDGDASVQRFGDSIRCWFDVEAHGFIVDSVLIRFSGIETIYFRDTANITGMGFKYARGAKHMRIRGTFTVEYKNKELPDTFSAVAWGRKKRTQSAKDGWEELVEVDGWKSLVTPNSLRFGLTHGYGYAKSPLITAGKSDAYNHCVSLEIYKPWRYHELSIASAYTGDLMKGKRLYLSDHFIIKSRFLPYGRTGFAPSFTLGIKNSRLDIDLSGTNFKNTDFSLLAALSLEGAHEQISYEYASGLGGHHTLSLWFGTGTDYSRLGTRYSWIHMDGADFFKMEVVVRGIGDDCSTESLLRPYRRSLPIRLLSVLPFLPFVLSGDAID